MGFFQSKITWSFTWLKMCGPLSTTHLSSYTPVMFTDLYNTDILSLSATLENTSLASPSGTARKVSKLCGSWVEIDLHLKPDSSLMRVDGKEIYVKDYYVFRSAFRVQACALGQASAAILKENILACDMSEIIEARDALRAMLKEGAEPPSGRFEKLALLAGVANYPARHASTMLAFEAAVAAFENAGVKPYHF